MRTFIIRIPAYLLHYVFQVQGSIFRLACTVCGNRAKSNYNLQMGLAALTKAILGRELQKIMQQSDLEQRPLSVALCLGKDSHYFIPRQCKSHCQCRCLGSCKVAAVQSHYYQVSYLASQWNQWGSQQRCLLAELAPVCTVWLKASCPLPFRWQEQTCVICIRRYPFCIS